MNSCTPELIIDLYGNFEELELFPHENHLDIVSQGILCLAIGWNELASKCKRRLYAEGYLIDSRTTSVGSAHLFTSPVSEKDDISERFVAISEAQSVIDAYQWTLDQVGDNA